MVVAGALGFRVRRCERRGGELGREEGASFVSAVGTRGGAAGTRERLECGERLGIGEKTEYMG
jgi:hypothetical protein